MSYHTFNVFYIVKWTGVGCGLNFQYPSTIHITLSHDMSRSRMWQGISISSTILITLSMSSTFSKKTFSNVQESDVAGTLSLLRACASFYRCISPLVDHPTQLICIWIFICYAMSTYKEKRHSRVICLSPFNWIMVIWFKIFRLKTWSLPYL